jgi:hypothetical protein
MPIDWPGRRRELACRRSHRVDRLPEIAGAAFHMDRVADGNSFVGDFTGHSQLLK